MTLLPYSIDDRVYAFSTERGASSDPEAQDAPNSAYAGFNLTHYCGDSPDHVRRCRRTLCNHLGIADSQLFLPRQVHGTRVARVTGTTRQDGLPDTDALITDTEGICIGISTADCVPLLLYDPTHRASAAIHAGWRGTVKKIVLHTLEAMQATFGTQPADLRAVIGPSISSTAFEVGEEVCEAFLTANFPSEIIHRNMPKPHIDLRAANRLLLTNTGVASENIQTSSVCTYSTPDRFFSARRLGIRSGRIFTGIFIR